MLLVRGADCTLATDSGWTSLTRAASIGHVGLVKLLLDTGAPLTLTKFGPLHVALCHNKIAVAELLLDRDVAISATSNE